MRIAVFGTGGVGGYFGGRLALIGEEVTFIARGAHMKAIQESGLRVDSVIGDFIVKDAQVVDNPEKVGPVEVVFVTVKAWQVPDAARAMRPLVGPNTIVVPLCNGIDAPDQLNNILDTGHILGGFCRISSNFAGPGHIRHVGVEPYAALGERDGSQNELAEQLREAFQRAGVLAEIPEDIMAAMWEKFLFITATSGVGAVTRVPIGVTREMPQTRQMILGSLNETLAVSQALRIRLPVDTIDSVMSFVDILAPDVIPSMQRDIMDGRPSELEAQTGTVVRLGSEVGVPTPVNEFIYNSLLPQEISAREAIKNK